MAELYDLAGQPVTDAWQRLADDQPLPANGRHVLVSLTRWLAERDSLTNDGCRVGLALDNTDDVDAIAGDLGNLALIALSFPVFGDGRAFSQAAALRGRLGYDGVLRATGDIQPDQALYLRRCGFTELEFQAHPAADLASLLRAFSRSYQPAPGDSPAAELNA